MRITVHKHDNLRRLCDLEISDADHAKLLKPLPLEDHFKALVSIEDGKPVARVVNRLQPALHLVEIDTAAGKLLLFPVTGNGQPYFATSTPEVAIANAA